DSILQSVNRSLAWDLVEMGLADADVNARPSVFRITESGRTYLVKRLPPEVAEFDPEQTIRDYPLVSIGQGDSQTAVSPEDADRWGWRDIGLVVGVVGAIVVISAALA